MEMTLGSSFALHPHGQAADTPAAAPMAQGAAKPMHHFSFDDFLDIVNPLQHLPVVGTLYRKITGDKIGTPEKIVGDGIYGGVWGLVSSVADTVFEAATGKNFGDTVLAFASDHLGISLPALADAKPSEPASDNTNPAVAQGVEPSQPTAVVQAVTPEATTRSAATAAKPSQPTPAVAAQTVTPDIMAHITAMAAGASRSAVKSSQSAPTTVARAATPDVAALTDSLSRHGFDRDTTQRALAAYRRMSMPGYAH